MLRTQPHVIHHMPPPASGFRIGLLLGLGLLLAGSALPRPALAQDAAQDLNAISRSLQELSNRVRPALVQVLVTGYSPFEDERQAGAALTRSKSTGSGFIVDPDGYIITNAHVVQGGERIEVLLNQPPRTNEGDVRSLVFETRRVPATVVGLDFETDVAVLKVAESGLPSLPFGEWADLRQGQLVFAFGAPRGLDNTMTMGLVSTPVRQFTPDYPMVYIQTDAPINPGNSGGPLVNADGEVVGINTMILSESGGSEGLGYATPSLVVELVYGKIRESGWFPKGTIGVRPQTVTPTMAHALGLRQDWGVMIADVIPGGPGAQAGLQQGDIAVAVDGEPVDNQLAFSWRIYEKAVGSPVQVEVVRNGRRVPVTARVTERPGDRFRPQTAVSPERNLLLRLGIMGIDLSELAQEVRLATRRPEGVAVLMAATASDRGGVGLAPGDVVYEINGRPVDGMGTLRSVMEALQPGAPVSLLVEREGSLFYLTFEVS